jgi:hypothetical protein
MFGWEFPPNISGGLGTACLGLTTSLIKQNVDVIFVVPKLFGDEEKNQLRFINATNIKINIEDPYYLRLIERLKEHKMIELMRINGKKLGESNLGNKIRWRKIE